MLVSGQFKRQFNKQKLKIYRNLIDQKLYRVFFSLHECHLLYSVCSIHLSTQIDVMRLNKCGTSKRRLVFLVLIVLLFQYWKAATIVFKQGFINKMCHMVNYVESVHVCHMWVVCVIQKLMACSEIIGTNQRSDLC